MAGKGRKSRKKGSFFPPCLGFGVALAAARNSPYPRGLFFILSLFIYFSAVSFYFIFRWPVVDALQGFCFFGWCGWSGSNLGSQGSYSPPRSLQSCGNHTGCGVYLRVPLCRLRAVAAQPTKPPQPSQLSSLLAAVWPVHGRSRGCGDWRSVCVSFWWRRSQRTSRL